MERTAEGSITGLLQEASAGRDGALDRLFPIVYEELRRVAHRQLGRSGGGHTLGTTALVHEAYLKLAGGSRLDCRDRGHFLGVAARAMRQVLIDYARRHRAAKRGGSPQRVSLDAVECVIDTQAETLLALDEALKRLEALSERLARVVECRFFGGMTEQETAVALGITPRTVRRDWAKARLWLFANLHDEACTGAPPAPAPAHRAEARGVRAP
jgi:RNA polymerase sigma-70 factor, ECF subfamily